MGSLESGPAGGVAGDADAAHVQKDEGESDWLERLDQPVELPGVPYVIWEGARPGGSPDGLYEAASEGSIGDALRACIACEAPVHERRVARMVLDRMGVRRLTSKVLLRCEELAVQAGGSDAPLKVGEFWWRRDQKPEEWPHVRHHNGNPAADRTVEEIPEREL